MWSLPDIRALNAKAAAEAATERPKGWEPWHDQACEYCAEPATHSEEYWDVFGEDPKGYVHTCDLHYEEHGGAHEGHFWCEACGRMHVDHYTWERYRHATDEGEILCLRCWFGRVVGDDEQWLTEARTIDLDYLRHRPHAIAVGSDYWRDDLDFVANAEFDNMNGHQISGDDLTGIVAKAVKEHGRCLVLMDAAWQFAVSFGVYVSKVKRPKRKARKR